MATSIVQKVCPRISLLGGRVGIPLITTRKFSTSRPKFRGKKVGAEKKATTWVKQKKKTIIAESPVDEEFASRVPDDDVYFMKYYPEPTLSFKDAIQSQREWADPTILNNKNGVVYVDLLLNMKTKKMTRFVGEVYGKIFFPHYFEYDCPRRIIVICKTSEEANIAREHGAIFAGDHELAARLHRKTGDLTQELFEILLCTPEMLELIAPHTSTLKNIFPNVETESLGTDIEKMIKKQKECFFYKTKREGHLGMSQMPIGRLDMTIEQLYENYQHYLNVLLSNPRNQPQEVQYITSVKLLAPPSPEQFKLIVTDISQGPMSPEEYEKYKASKEKKKKMVEESAIDLMAANVKENQTVVESAV